MFCNQSKLWQRLFVDYVPVAKSYKDLIICKGYQGRENWKPVVNVTK